MLWQMEKVESPHGGQFTLRSHPVPMEDGKYQMRFAVIEHEWHGDVPLKHHSGEIFDTEVEAANAGLAAARDWLRQRLMVNHWHQATLK